MQSGWICPCSRRRKRKSVLRELDTMLARFDPRPLAIRNHPNEASDDGLRQKNRLGLTCGRHCTSSVVEAWYAKVGVTSGPYPSLQRGPGINRFRRQCIIAVEELSCRCQWSHSDEIGILVLPRHRLCAVAGCFAAAKLPAGLAAWDG